MGSPFNRPFVFSMGPQRAGTSWLDRYLRQRGDICLPADVKETFFFDRHYDRGIDFYTNHFKPTENHKFLMEISTTSFDCEDAPKRVASMMGTQTTLLCPLRDPVVRAYSLYLHYLRYGLIFPGLEKACIDNPQILGSSHYAQHLENWISTFGQKQLKIVFQEDLKIDQNAYIANICTLLSFPYQPVEGKLTERYNATTFSRSGAIASLAQRGADLLRKYKLYPIINAAKAIGLKQVIFGKERPDAEDTTIPPQHREFLENKLGQERENLEKLIGPIPQWSKT